MKWLKSSFNHNAEDFPPYYPGRYPPKKKGIPCLLLFELIFSIAGIGLGTLVAFWLLAFLFALFL